MVFRHSPQITDEFARDAVAPQRDQQRKCPEVHHRVNQEINVDSSEASWRVRDEAKEDVAYMRDGTVGEESLEAALREGGDAADSEARDRRDYNHGPPDRLGGRQR